MKKDNVPYVRGHKKHDGKNYRRARLRGAALKNAGANGRFLGVAGISLRSYRES